MGPNSLELGKNEQESEAEKEWKKLDGIIDNHQEIIDWIKDNNLCLISIDPNTGKSLIRTILEAAGDGHKIVNQVLDSYVSASDKLKSHSNKFGVTIDFSGIIREDESTGRQKSVLEDILDLKMKYQDTVFDSGLTWCYRMIENKEDFADTFKGKRFFKKLIYLIFN